VLVLCSNYPSSRNRLHSGLKFDLARRQHNRYILRIATYLHLDINSDTSPAHDPSALERKWGEPTTFRRHFIYTGVLTLAIGAFASGQRPAGEAGAQSPATTEGTRVSRRPPAYPQHPPSSPAVVAQGKRLFEANCSFCHGSDARGGETGPNLVRAEVVLDDQHGELITPIVRNGIPSKGMPKFELRDSDIVAIAAFLHSLPLANRGAPSTLDILVGNATAGQAYFNEHCTTCHSATGDLAGIGTKFDPKILQNLIVSGGAEGFGFRGRDATPPNVPPTTVTVTLSSGEVVTGTLDQLSAFVVGLKEADGTYRSFLRNGAVPKVVVDDPLQWHIDMLSKWDDTDIHNLTSYLVTLK
jgi:cytochrome c oxidase cbb3-type subunit III